MKSVSALAGAVLLAVAGTAAGTPPPHAGGPPSTPPGQGSDHGNPGGNGNPNKQEHQPSQNPNAGERSSQGPLNGAGGHSPGFDGSGIQSVAGKSHVAHAMLKMIDENGDFLSDDGLPWARMMYFWHGPTFDFVFNGHDFAPNPDGETSGAYDYVLTYQPEPMPAAGVICLGEGTVNGGGNLHIADSVELDSDLPPGVSEVDPGDDELPVATLVLVPTADVDCELGEMLQWLPEDYLFSTAVRYFDSDL